MIVTDNGTNLSRGLTTDSKGDFEAEDINPGTYTVYGSVRPGSRIFAIPMCSDLAADTAYRRQPEGRRSQLDCDCYRGRAGNSDGYAIDLEAA